MKMIERISQQLTREQLGYSFKRILFITCISGGALSASITSEPTSINIQSLSIAAITQEIPDCNSYVKDALERTLNGDIRELQLSTFDADQEALYTAGIYYTPLDSPDPSHRVIAAYVPNIFSQTGHEMIEYETEEVFLADSVARLCSAKTQYLFIDQTLRTHLSVKAEKLNALLATSDADTSLLGAHAVGDAEVVDIRTKVGYFRNPETSVFELQPNLAAGIEYRSRNSLKGRINSSTNPIVTINEFERPLLEMTFFMPHANSTYSITIHIDPLSPMAVVFGEMDGYAQTATIIGTEAADRAEARAGSDALCHILADGVKNIQILQPLITSCTEMYDRHVRSLKTAAFDAAQDEFLKNFEVFVRHDIHRLNLWTT